jgi:ketopantoate hydroxymethyltransferase
MEPAPTMTVATRRDTHAQARGTRTALVVADLAGRTPRFVKRYADTRGSLLGAARQYVTEVASQHYPDQAHSYA